MPEIERLPLFPLGLVLYPYERLPLHIFEPRYKDMIRDCQAERRPFGVVLFDEGKVSEVGCTARLSRIVNRYEDGRLDILVRGEARFRVLDIFEDQTYLTADVKPIDEPKEPPERDLRERVITQHMRLLELAGRTVRPSLYQDVPHLSYVIAHNAGLTPTQKQELLELLKENERIAYLAKHLEMLLPRIEQLEDVRRRVQSNGHFKDFPPEN